MSNKTQLLSVVDDEQDIMCLFRDVLSQIGGIDVLGFTDPTSAFEHFKLNESNYSLILSDFRMPGMPIEESKGKVDEEDFEQNNCVDAYLQKPISIPDLIDAVETQIKGENWLVRSEENLP